MSDALVIIGGGTAGAAAALFLRKKLPSYPMVLVEKKATLSYASSYPAVITGKKSREELSRSINNLQKHKIALVTETAQEIDVANRTVKTRNQKIFYRYLIIATGVEDNIRDFPGLKEAGLSIHQLEDMAKAQRLLTHASIEEVVLVAPSTVRSYPLILYEVAFLLEDFFRKQHLRGQVNFSIYYPESTTAPLYGENISRVIEDHLLARRIRFFPNYHLKKVNPDSRILDFSHDQVFFDLLFYTPPASPPPLISNSGLGDEDGWLPADPYYLSTPYENVYVLGDSSRVISPAGLELPKMSSIAYSHALTVSKNIIQRIKKKKATQRETGKYTFILDLGSALLPARGNFYTSPPEFKTMPPSIVWRPLKNLKEKQWLKEHS